MKPKHLIIATAALLLVGVQASAYANWWSSDDDVKGNGNVVEHSQNLDKVDELDLALPAKIKVVRGENSITIKAEENLQAYIVVKTDGDELEVRAKKGYDLHPTKPIEITISVETLSELSLAGSGDVKVAAFSGSDDLKLDLSGSGSITMDSAEYPKVSIDIAGSSGVTIHGGNTDKLSVDIAGSGDVDTHKLAARDVKVDIAGSGDVAVRASGSLDIDIAGSGDVDYYGSPTIKQSVMGSGDVSRKGD